MGINDTENYGPPTENNYEKSHKSQTNLEGIQAPEIAANREENKNMILEKSYIEKCDLATANLKMGISISDERSFDSIKSFLGRNNIFDLTHVNYSDMSYNGSKFILKYSQNGNELGVYYDNQQTPVLKNMGSIKSGEKFVKEITLQGLLPSSDDILRNSLIFSDFNEFECDIIEQPPTILEVKEERKTDTEIKKQTEEDKIQEANKRIEQLSQEEYTVKTGDVLMKIIKNKYGLKMAQSSIEAIKEVVKYNKVNGVDLSNDTNPEDGVPGDKLKIGQTLYLPENLEIIQTIQNQDRERRIAFNKAKGIKMKKNFK